jgi:hypothetical protein
MSEPITLTGLLAVYGTIISTVALFWNIFRDLLDMPRLQLSARLGRLAKNEVTGQLYAADPDLPVHGATEQLFVFLDVTNVGRRPARWDGWGGKHSKKVNGQESFVVIPVSLPKMLNEGESHTEMTPELHDGIDNVRRISIWDASGKKWHLPNKELKKLKQAVHKQVTDKQAKAASAPKQ